LFAAATAACCAKLWNMSARFASLDDAGAGAGSAGGAGWRADDARLLLPAPTSSCCCAVGARLRSSFIFSSFWRVPSRVLM
jgi:hypothetical protein